jgi:MFS family permease
MSSAESRSIDGSFNPVSLVLPFYLPSGLAFLGVGLAVPLLALYARHLGAGNAGAAFIVGLVGLGSLVFNIPAGQLIAGLGIRRVIIVSTCAEGLFALGASLAPNPWFLGAMAFGIGMTQTTFFVARLSYFKTFVPTHHRGKALALIGGGNRLGNLLGPIAGGFIAQLLGYRYSYLAYAVLMSLSCVSLVRWAPRAARPPRPEAWTPAQSLAIVRSNAGIFATAGLAIIILQIMRTARQALVPLVANSLGLSVSQVGMVIALMYFVEILLVYPSGIAMDRWGRKIAAVPCLVFLALGLSMLTLVNGLPMMLLAVIVAGIGNGLGSGINMTLSTDFAPSINPGRFIGVWRLIVDLGTMSGPFIVGLVIKSFSLSGAALTVAVIGLAGAGIMGFLAPESHTGKLAPETPTSDGDGGSGERVS